MNLELSRAESGDAVAIAHLLRTSFEPSIVDKLIYGCSGVQVFIRGQIEQPLSDTQYYVARHDGAIGASVVMKVSAKKVSLGYIAVSSEMRGSGVGKRLLAYALHQCRRGQDVIDLDVFVHNDIARRWYMELGFTPVSRTTYWEFDAGEPDHHASIYVAEWPQAQACHSAFGFSQFCLNVSGKDISVGRVGTRWFRLPTAEAVTNGDVHAMLASIDAGRRIYAVLPDESVTEWVQNKGLRTISVDRMQAHLNDVQHRLSERMS